MALSFRLRYKSVFLAVLVALFLLQRAGLLLYGYSHSAHPGFDETASGVLTCDLLDGSVRAPLFVYQYESRSGDSLIEGLLLVPFFSLFGRSLFSLKLLALFSAFLSLLCWISLLKRCQGVGTACIFAALFTFAPLMFARLNLMGTIASHHLINPLIAVQLLVLFRIIERESASGSLWLSLGVLAGLGSYTFYTYIIFNLYCFLFLLMARPRLFTARPLGWFLCGCLAGFSPWIARLSYSTSGGSYLASILKNVNFNFWTVIQNVLFNFPHSFGYSYPLRNMGIISPLFFLLFLLMSWVIVRAAYRHRTGRRDRQFGTPAKLSPPLLQGVFVVLFPFFFLLCLSLSPMKIVPFEYWPTIGFFGNFSVADVYRYRWLYPLFPFSFAVMAGGVSLIVQSSSVRRLSSLGIIGLLGFVLLWGLGKGVTLCDKSDFGRIFSYKGYNYDQMANRFVLHDSAPVDAAGADRYAGTFPVEIRGEVYRCLGTRVALALGRDPQGSRKFARFLAEIDPVFLNDFIYGVVRSAQQLTEKEFRVLKAVLVKTDPASFYENWGSRNIGYRYYGLFLNRGHILEAIPDLEKRVFSGALEEFEAQLSDGTAQVLWNSLAETIGQVPVSRRAAVIKGIGKLVGAEMLFDPVTSPDYPLDSRVGEQFARGTLRDAFYEGVGAGFAETLNRFWRRLLLPEDPEDPRATVLLDREWERCQHLMGRVSPLYSSRIKKGFLTELTKRPCSDPIRFYLHKKVTSITL